MAAGISGQGKIIFNNKQHLFQYNGNCNRDVDLYESTVQTKHTGSFKKNGKSKTVFMGIKFHEKLIFSAFFSRELATNLRC